MAFLVENHHRGRREGLRHRANAEDAVGLHRLSGFAILHALRFEVSDLAVTHHQRDRAGDALVVDILLHGFADTLETLGRQPDEFGFGGGKFLRGRGGGKKQHTNEQQGAQFAGHLGVGLLFCLERRSP
jgi:hypothetical protein